MPKPNQRTGIQDLCFSAFCKALLLYGILDSLLHLSNLVPRCGRREWITFMNLSWVGGLKPWPPGGIYLWAAALLNFPSWEPQPQQAEAASDGPSHAGGDVCTPQHSAGSALLGPDLIHGQQALLNFSRTHKIFQQSRTAGLRWTLHLRDLPSLHSIPGCWNEMFNPKNAKIHLALPEGS